MFSSLSREKSVKKFDSNAWLVLLLFAMLVLVSPSSHACTTFALPTHNNLVVGKSYDWHAGQGVVFVNPAKVRKKATDVNGSFAEKAAWTSKYGSVSFTQFGIDLPLGGVNQKGLVVEIMWLNATKYPVEQSLPVLNELQWIQYILDLAATTDEAEELAKKVQVQKVFAPVHYMVCDLEKNCSSFEYLDKELTITRQPVKTLTNTPYAISLAALKQFEAFGGQQADPVQPASLLLKRFQRASFGALLLQTATDDLKVDPTSDNIDKSTFAILDTVRSRTPGQDFVSQWQIVYQPAESTVRFRIPKKDAVFKIDTSSFEYDCTKSAPKVADLRGDVLSAVSPKQQFVDYDQTLHHDLIFGSGNASIGSPFAADLHRGISAALHDRTCVP